MYEWREGGTVRRVVAVGWRRTRAVGAYATAISANNPQKAGRPHQGRRIPGRRRKDSETRAPDALFATWKKKGSNANSLRKLVEQPVWREPLSVRLRQGFGGHSYAQAPSGVSPLGGLPPEAGGVGWWSRGESNP